MSARRRPGPPNRLALDGYTHTWRVNDRVWSPTALVGAVVTEVGYGAIKVRWDDNNCIQVLHPSDVLPEDEKPTTVTDPSGEAS